MDAVMRQLQYDRERHDLHATVVMAVDELWSVLGPAITDSRVEVLSAHRHLGCFGLVRSRRGYDLGTFEVRWHETAAGRLVLTSQLVESVVGRPVSTPRALGAYGEAMARARTAVAPWAVHSYEPAVTFADATVTSADAVRVTPAWHADPYQQARLRWHDGTSWTAHVAR